MDAPPPAAATVSNGLAAAAPLASAAASSALSSASPAAPTSASTPAPASRLHLISDVQEFTPSLSSSLEQWHLLDAGFAYNLCAVLGSQSTGKSTLLNRLFGTSFDVMDERVRGQTTKGIWLCRALTSPLLVMDVEGTDGRERGEDQDFERKSALFSMASAECLIVNLWEHQVGLYQGANMGLLKTVFEVNLALFQSGKGRSSSTGRDKTLLFFVIRDHVGATPLSNLRETLLADLARIWDGLNKPEGQESCRITDFFDLSFTTLPHKLLQPDEFERQVALLRERFVERDHPEFVFKKEYHKRIPADGLPMYLETIWEQVMTNKDLDLPTQQELLAQFRCDEIASAAFVVFTTAAKVFKKPIEAGQVLETLGAEMGTLRSEALSKFDKDASRYHAEVYRRKRSELLEKLNATLSPLFMGQLKNTHKLVLASFRSAVLERLRGENYDFADVVSGERSRALAKFTAAAKAVQLADTDWNVEEETQQLESAIDAIADQCRADETKKMLTLIERALRKAIAEPVELGLARPGPQMWDAVLEAFGKALAQAEATYLRKAKGFNCTEEESVLALAALRRRAWRALRAKLDEQTADSFLAAKLRGVFEDRFRYDEAGTPRVWSPTDDIDGLYRAARDETLALVPLYARIEPDNTALLPSIPSTSDDPALAAAVERGEEEEFDFESSLTLFGEARKADIAARLRKEADAYYVEAKRSTVSSIAQVPVWMYAVLAALGWNEAMAVLRSPLYFAFMLILLASAYVVYRLNLSGPLVQVSKAVGREVHRLADGALREHFQQPLPQPAMLRDDRVPAEAPAKPAVSASSAKAAAPAAAPEEIELSER